MTRDMSKAEFQKACSKHGFIPQGFLGYFRLPISGHNLNISILNAGANRRAQLAYLIRETARLTLQYQRNEAETLAKTTGCYP